MPVKLCSKGSLHGIFAVSALSVCETLVVFACHADVQWHSVAKFDGVGWLVHGHLF